MQGQDWIARTGELFEAAMFRGDTSALDRSDDVLDTVEAPLAMARGKVLHVRFLNDREENAQELALFERAAALYERLGDVRGEADALFWVGCWHQVVKGDGVTGRPYFERSYALARSVDDRMTMSYAIRHLGFADRDARRFDRARERLTESVALRREIGFRPGEAAGLVALAYLAAETGDPAAASHHLDEARSVAESCGAKAVSGWIEEARTHIRS
ncbi:tetratricopeptide repeat protein [Streptomyces caniscabiei]|uniref:Tetratricopeptide repeat protein n=1 Tax=Streptomyces caniscabiei TaxID=2746961 RepID=A0A927LB62_9ACTN|nr:tetratricopeptide repeat protein [Streptomyces caniscabiei]MBD9729455.1 tetratricopeptide repeat protein [Streptomyces caniscabiei]MDX3515070.1 tetratricopeptide repeat protein [Streptomyces caniscabiei]MDX3718192.1 tetratricopeptide repeat protein [Streptomyces caniscabiei]MDX3732867.1 tetratricopeptide repeat protein [Streptomyces caniscabiei]WEO22389.1 tetratricopeptide repeat protein [Streptomyces caniscabiei]